MRYTTSLLYCVESRDTDDETVETPHLVKSAALLFDISMNEIKCKFKSRVHIRFFMLI